MIRKTLIRTHRPERVFDHQAEVRKKSFAVKKKRGDRKKLVKLFLLALFFVMVMVLIFNLPGIVRNASQPFKKLPGKFANYNSINPKGRVYILLLTKKGQSITELGLATYEPSSETVSVALLPPNSKSSISEKGLTFNQIFIDAGNSSLDRLFASVTGSIGYPVDGYLVLDGVDWVDKEHFLNLKNYIYSFGFFLSLGNKSFLNDHLKTNLDLGNLYSIAGKLKSVRDDNIRFINLASSITLEGFLDSEEVGNKLGNSFSDSVLLKESDTVEVVNNSNVKGMGNTVKAILTHIGVNVLSVSDGEETKETVIKVKEKNLPLARRLKDIFRIKNVEASLEKTSVDAKIFIGNDFAKNFDF